MSIADYLNFPQWSLAFYLFLFGIWQIQKKVFKKVKCNTGFVFLYFCFLIYGIATPFSTDISFLITGVKQNHPFYPIIANGMFFLFFTLGLIASTYFIPSQQRINNSYSKAENNPFLNDIFIITTCGILLAFLAVFVTRGTLFDFAGFFSNYFTVAEYGLARTTFATTNSELPGIGIFNKIIYGISTYVLCLTVFIKRSKIYKIVVFSIVVLAIASNGHKMEISMGLGIICLAKISKVYDLQFGRKLKYFGALLPIVLILFLTVMYYLQGLKDWELCFFWGFERVLLEPQRVLDLYFEVYPDFHPFLQGGSSKLLSNLVYHDNEFIEPSLYIPKFFLNLEHTSFPCFFIGYAYSDFGFIGVCSYSFLVAILISFFNHLFSLPNHNNVDSKALFLATSISLVQLIQNNFVTVLYTYGIIPNLVIYFLIYNLKDQKWVTTINQKTGQKQ